MKKKLLTAVVTFALMTIGWQPVQAKSWRINNSANRKAHFADLNEAMASNEVVAGDTLYLDPGCNITGRQDVTKQVTIIGLGYFLSDAKAEAIISGALYLKGASTKMTGVQTTAQVYLGAKNILLERCKLGGVQSSGSAPHAIIRQCYFPDGNINGAGNTSDDSAHWIIENCIIIRKSGWDPIARLFYPVIRNNYVRSDYEDSAGFAYINNGTVVNNIFLHTKNMTNGGRPYSVADCTITNNVFHCNVQSTYPDNVFISSNTEAAVFAMEGSNDQLYQLKEDSPAKGAATDGGDIGPTSGIFPYLCSGYPLGIPRLVSGTVDASPQDGQVRVSQQVIIQNQ